MIALAFGEGLTPISGFIFSYCSFEIGSFQISSLMSPSDGWDGGWALFQLVGTVPVEKG